MNGKQFGTSGLFVIKGTGGHTIPGTTNTVINAVLDTAGGGLPNTDVSILLVKITSGTILVGITVWASPIVRF